MFPNYPYTHNHQRFKKTGPNGIYFVTGFIQDLIMYKNIGKTDFLKI